MSKLFFDVLGNRELVDGYQIDDSIAQKYNLKPGTISPFTGLRTSNLPVEALEIEYPLTLLRYELVDGSGGAGRQRGGMGLRRVYRAEADCRVRVDGARLLSPPWGLFGGLPGAKAAVVLRGGAAPFDHGSGALRPGEIIEVITAGSGGYGPPAERDRDAVRRDLAEGRIDHATAPAVYGL